MRRRTFVSNTLAILAWPLTSVAQPAGKVWRIGYLVLNPLTDTPSPERAAFIAALRELGYAVGSNLTIEYRSADSDKERLPFLADELVQAKMDAIVVGSSDPARAAMRTTTSIPIIMLGVGDPVAFGLVTNLARPGSNITGPSWQSVDLRRTARHRRAGTTARDRGTRTFASRRAVREHRSQNRDLPPDHRRRSHSLEDFQHIGLPRIRGCRRADVLRSEPD